MKVGTVVGVLAVAILGFALVLATTGGEPGVSDLRAHACDHLEQGTADRYTCKALVDAMTEEELEEANRLGQFNRAMEKVPEEPNVGQSTEDKAAAERLREENKELEELSKELNP